MMIPDQSHSDVIAGLYPRLAPQVRRVVGAHLQVPDWLLDDACQMAWTTLLSDPEQVDEAHLLGWLATTARREALHMLRRSEVERRVLRARPAPDERDEEADPERAIEFWDRLAQVRRLPRRQQQMIWMQGLGYGYRDIAVRTGRSERTVKRQMTDARRRLRSAA